MRSVFSPQVVNIEDLRRLARRRLPRVVFDYLDGGAEAEITLRENRRAFEEVTLRPRHGVAVADCDLRTRVLANDLAFPALLAPIGYSSLLHSQGEPAAARAAGEAGTAYILSTISGYPLEQVKAASSGPAWYQLYLIGGRDTAEPAIERARRAGFSALVVTIDTPVAGMRERDVRNGARELLNGTLLSMIPFLPQLFARPAWLTGFLLSGGIPKLPNVQVTGQGPMPLVDVTAALAHAAVRWEDLQWMQEAWQGPIVVKGILNGEDARRAVDHGASAIVVSNHGGRQLDGVSASLRALPEIVNAVEGRADVLVDGGIRRGSDIVKAICLGARAVLIGRAYAYGLAAAGHAGVTRAIQILRADLERTLKLLGCPAISHLDPSYLLPPPGWPARPS